MKSVSLKSALNAAVKAARAAGQVMHDNWYKPKHVNSAEAHDIKLELDVRCQKLIEKTLAKAFPQIPVLGEEGSTGDVSAQYRWVVDPIDGTVNYFFGMPHAAVSIALQIKNDQWQKPTGKKKASRSIGNLVTRQASHISVVGVIYDPFTGELWTTIKGDPTRLNGKVIRVSNRSKIEEAIIAMGFSKNQDNLNKSIPHMIRLSRRAKKIRIMGSAALELVYVASGRLDAYIERTINLWDVAAGALLVENAGGEFYTLPRARWKNAHVRRQWKVAQEASVGQSVEVKLVILQDKLLKLLISGTPSMFNWWRVCLLALLFSAVLPSYAGTLVQFRTTFGDFEMELYDQDKPVTVQNFIRYIQSGRYENEFSHRLVPGFVLQGGGFILSSNTISPISTYAPITNEFNVGKFYSNIYGTIAMAKTSDPNSATSQFFINLADNSASLDSTNNSGGFTVFGHVINGTNVINVFNKFQNYDGSQQSNLVANLSGSYGSSFVSCPLLYPSVAATNFVFIDITLLQVAIQKISDGAEISWNSTTGLTNVVEYTTSFPPVWNTLISTNGNGARMTAVDNTTDSKRFYRVRVID